MNFLVTFILHLLKFVLFRIEAHLVYKHTQKPNFLISNAR